VGLRWDFLSKRVTFESDADEPEDAEAEPEMDETPNLMSAEHFLPEMSILETCKIH